MTRQEFLRELQVAMQGEMDQGAVNENIKFYDNYIMEESRKGKSEEEVIAQLGSPRLIAKTLIDTAEKIGPSQEQSYSGSYRQTSGADRGFRADYSQQDGWDVRFGGLRLNTWYGKLLLILLAGVLIIIVANVVAFLLPILVPIIVILLLYSLIFGGRR
ncbi:MAG: DUF1700 domain-containing protein [Lachnospiraceae bacterium]|nr:DUF1700 domain-containing protein [Lachnospiraceae bacterium]